MRSLTLLTLSMLCSAGLAQDLRDPTRPPSPAEIEAWFAGGQAAATPADAYRLQSVLLSPTRRVAVIDGRHVLVGESVGNAEVTAIEPGRVELERDGETIVLRIGTPSTNEFEISGN
jgi:MSHA biogenesis protein MshK